MKVLVAYGSRHHATEQIAEAIGIALIDRGLMVDVRSVQDAGDINGYDVFIIGSAIYMGRWVKPVSAFVKSHSRLLLQRPVWLFSSGPIGDPPLPAEEARETVELAKLVQARGTKSFGGCLEKVLLSWSEKLMVNALRAEEGDFRRWPAIHDWADTIADALGAPTEIVN